MLGALIPVYFLQSTFEYQELADYSQVQSERDVFLGALNLINVVESTLPPSSGPVGFWYAQQPGLHWLLVSVQSTYLYAYSRLPGEAPKPSADFINALSQKKNLVILGLTDSEVANSVAAVYHAGVQARLITTATYHGRAWSYSYAIMRLTPTVTLAHGHLLARLSASSLRLASSQAKLAPIASGEVRLESDPRRWSYGAQVALTETSRKHGDKVDVCVTAKVLSGALGVAVSARKSFSEIIAEATISPADGKTKVPTTKGPTAQASDGPSVGDIVDISIYRSKP